tara:strand:+ start:5494 stop:6174 length:681 start_codon:yes stop_codon:yes gene_type:complete
MNQVYVLTGCSSGLGYSLLKKLLNENKKVVGISRNIGNASEFEDLENFVFLQHDLANKSFSEVEKKLTFDDNVDIYLILNAANFIFEGEKLLDDKKLYELFEINYFSNVKLVNFFMKQNLRRCMIINSISGLESQPGQFQYSASKHSLQSFGENLSCLSKNKKFDVMNINPGGMNTELWDKTKLLKKEITNNFLDPDELSNLLVNLINMKGKVYIKSFKILPEHDV